MYFSGFKSFGLASCYRYDDYDFSMVHTLSSHFERTYTTGAGSTTYLAYDSDNKENDLAYDLTLELIDPALITNLFDFDSATEAVDAVKTLRVTAVSGTETYERTQQSIGYVRVVDSGTTTSYTAAPETSYHHLATVTYAVVGGKARRTTDITVHLYTRSDDVDSVGSVVTTTRSWDLTTTNTYQEISDFTYVYNNSTDEIDESETFISSSGSTAGINTSGQSFTDGPSKRTLNGTTTTTPTVETHTIAYTGGAESSSGSWPGGSPSLNETRFETDQTSSDTTIYSRLFANSVQTRHNDTSYLFKVLIEGDANTVTGGTPTKFTDLSMTIATVDGAYKYSEIDTLTYQTESCLSFTNVTAWGESVTPTVTRAD